MYKKVTLLLFALLVIAISIMTLFDQREISYLERRSLAEFPKVEIADPDFWQELDDYLSDHLLFRDEFIKINNLSNKYLLSLKDNRGVYTKDGYLFDILECDEGSITNLIHKTNDLMEEYFKDRAYFVAIPRKNDYSEKYFPGDLRYDEVFPILKEGLLMEMIEIADLLSLDSYYQTDIHWREEKLVKVAERIVLEMGDEYKALDADLKKAGTFMGALYSRSFLDVREDDLNYLDFDQSAIKVYDLEKNALVKVYDKEALKSPDAYDFFLDGPSAYLKITNEKVKNGQKLIVFRDSFASALLPLLIDSYEEICVIDLRYFNESLLDELSLDKKAKVLFIYGLEFINQSGALR